MKRVLLAIAFFLLAARFCVAGQEEIVLLTSADNPPYEFMRAGEIVGFDIDLAKMIAEKLGKKLIIKDMPFSSIIPALMSKRGDFAMAAITPTNNKRENVDFSINYQNNTSAIVLANREEFSFMDGQKSVFPLPLLEGKTIAVQSGTHHESDVIAANIPDLIIRRYDNIGAMVAEISNAANGNSTVYALIIGESEAKALIKKNSKLCYLQLQFEDFFAIALPKNSPIRADVNKIIELLKETGKLSDLEIKWDINR
jgi:polar amino acid transport system substrate-binding protein